MKDSWWYTISLWALEAECIDLVLASPFITCVILGNLIFLCHRFLIRKMGVWILPISELFWELNEIIYLKNLVHKTQ